MAIIKRGKDTYQLEYSAGTDINGKRIRYVKTVHCTKREAEKEYARFVIDCEDGNIHKNTPTTMEQLSHYYIENYSKRYKKQNTVKSDLVAVNSSIIPLLGNAQISKLRKIDIQAWVNTLDDKGLSPKTIRNRFSVLRSMLDYAIDMELLIDNPCRNVRLPKATKTEAHSFTKEEVAILLQALDKLSEKDYRYKCFILLALFGGFRKGEILGFNWSDLDGDVITITRTRYGDGEGRWEDTPKTEKSARTVTLPHFVIAELNELKKTQDKDQLICGDDHFKSDALLKNEIGEPLSGDYMYRWFVRFCKANNLPQYGLHSLRHTHASMLATLGADKVEVSNRLGHSQLSTTLNIYTHLFENRDTNLANQLEQFNSKIKEG